MSLFPHLFYKERPFNCVLCPLVVNATFSYKPNFFLAGIYKKKIWHIKITSAIYS